MRDTNQIALMVVVAGAINWLSAIQKGKDGTPVVVGNVVLFMALILLADFWRADISKMLAALYLLSTFLRDGAKFMAQIISVLRGFGATI